MLHEIQTSLKHSEKANMMLKQNNVGAHSTVIFLASINCFAMVSFLAVICKTVLKKKQKKCDTAVPILTSLLTCSVMGRVG